MKQVKINKQTMRSYNSVLKDTSWEQYNAWRDEKYDVLSRTVIPDWVKYLGIYDKFGTALMNALGGKVNSQKQSKSVGNGLYIVHKDFRYADSRAIGRSRSVIRSEIIKNCELFAKLDYIYVGLVKTESKRQITQDFLDLKTQIIERRQKLVRDLKTEFETEIPSKAFETMKVTSQEYSLSRNRNSQNHTIIINTIPVTINKIKLKFISGSTNSTQILVDGVIDGSQYGLHSLSIRSGSIDGFHQSKYYVTGVNVTELPMTTHLDILKHKPFVKSLKAINNFYKFAGESLDAVKMKHADKLLINGLF